MKSAMRKSILFLIISIMLPQLAAADMGMFIHGVQIKLKNGKILNGYITSDEIIDSCNKSADFDNNLGGSEFIFCSKLVRIKSHEYGYGPELFAAKSSVKLIKRVDIKSIKGVCRKWSNKGTNANHSVPELTDYMAQYVTNHKMIAAYEFDHESLPYDDEEYSYSSYTRYYSYNPEYPRKRLMKQRKLINKMSDDVLDKNKLIRFTYATD